MKINLDLLPKINRLVEQSHEDFYVEYNDKTDRFNIINYTTNENIPVSFSVDGIDSVKHLSVTDPEWKTILENLDDNMSYELFNYIDKYKTFKN
jgi:hypothetical protein